jgi:hypothetical protein
MPKEDRIIEGREVLCLDEKWNKNYSYFDKPSFTGKLLLFPVA